MRNRTPRVAIAFVLLAVLFGTAASCPAVAPGEDAKVVRTQQGLAIGQNVFDTGMTWCKANAAKLSPAGLALVNKIRVDFPLAYRAVDAALDTYKAGKTGDLDAAMAKFQKLVGQIEGLVASFGGPDLATSPKGGTP
jgi:hypothetical protein